MSLSLVAQIQECFLLIYNKPITGLGPPQQEQSVVKNNTGTGTSI